MSKKTRLMRVDEEFFFYVNDFQKVMKIHGKDDMSLVDVTKLIAKRDSKFFNVKKRGRNDDEFFDVLGM